VRVERGLRWVEEDAGLQNVAGKGSKRPGEGRSRRRGAGRGPIVVRGRRRRRGRAKSVSGGDGQSPPRRLGHSVASHPGRGGKQDTAGEVLLTRWLESCREARCRFVRRSGKMVPSPRRRRPPFGHLAAAAAQQATGDRRLRGAPRRHGAPPLSLNRSPPSLRLSSSSSSSSISEMKEPGSCAFNAQAVRATARLTKPSTSSSASASASEHSNSTSARSSSR